MRVLLGVFVLAVVGSTAFAVSELRALKRHVSQSAAEAPTVVEAAVEAVGPAQPRAVAPPLSTWKEALPFGGVPGAPADESSVESETDAENDILDSEDRCPDDSDGEDGCPGIIKLSVPEPRIILIDGRRSFPIDEQRRIVLPEGQSPLVITLEEIEID
jgi:hypothetical protein